MAYFFKQLFYGRQTASFGLTDLVFHNDVTAQWDFELFLKSGLGWRKFSSKSGIHTRFGNDIQPLLTVFLSLNRRRPAHLLK